MDGQGRLRAWFGPVGLLGIGVTIAPAAFADSLFLTNGDVIEGKVVRGTLNTLTVLSRGTVHLASLADIELAVLELDDGSDLSGQPLSWKEGVLEIRSDGVVLQVADGRILTEPAENDPAVAAAPRDSNETENVPSRTISTTILPTFTLKNGKTMVGKILHATGSIITLQPYGASAIPMSKADIVSVRIEPDDGDAVSGRLIHWEEGTYRLKQDDHEVVALLADRCRRAITQACSGRRAGK